MSTDFLGSDADADSDYWKTKYLAAILTWFSLYNTILKMLDLKTFTCETRSKYIQNEKITKLVKN